MAQVLTTRQAAEQLGVSLRTVQLWVESGVLNAWKTAGGHRRIAQSSVALLLEQQRVALGDTPSDERLRILIVEDDEDLLQLYRLTAANWSLPVQVVTASNGFEGLIRLGHFRPDILITDLMMPGMDGVEMLRILRNNPEYDNIAIIVVSSLSQPEINARGGLPDGISLFSKPVPFNRVEKLVRTRLDSHAKPATKPAT